MSAWTRRWASVAATLVAAPGVLALPATPATASRLAPCAGDSGVAVIVDFHQLGGGVQTACDPAGGDRVAAGVFQAAGFPLTYVQQTPGFTCRVSGKPSTDACVRTPPATAYWSLWWSDGRSGTWSYATVGVGSLKVPDGGYVAFSWQGQSGRAVPGISPTPRRPADPAPAPSSSTPSPDKASDKPPKSDPTSEPDKGDEQPGPTPSATAEAQEREKAEATPSSDPSESFPAALGDPSPSAAPSTDAVTAEPGAPRDEPGRLPGWLSGVLILGLAGAATTAWWWRRPASGGP